MKLIGEFEVVSVGDDTMAVPVGCNAEDNHFVIRLNDSAAEIFEMLKDEISEDEIVAQLTDKYENDREEIASYVRDVINEFSEYGILADIPAK